MIIDGSGPRSTTDFAEDLADAGEIARIQRPDLRGEAAAGDEIDPTRMS